MKASYYLLFAILLIGFTVSATAQITNLIVNGSSTSFTMTSGDTIKWEYNIPSGATANGELWYDVNGNGIIEPLSDKARFIFTQTDGDTSGNGGPPDMDRTVNGHIIFAQPIGIGPGKYIFKLTHNSVSQMVTGTALALSSPAHTISGTITPPPGKSAQYIFVEARRNESYGLNFWDAITNAGGSYSIQMNADTAGNPWRIRLADNYNPFPPAIVSPDEISLTITGNPSGNNFGFLPAAAQVAGYLKDENNNPLPSQGVSLFRNDGGVNRQSRANGSGFFQIGLLSADLTGQTWSLESECNCNNGVTGSQLTAQISLPVINSGDSLSRTLIVYSTNSQIQGQVQIDGSPPGFPVEVTAQVTDTGQAYTWSDAVTGNFTVNVSNKLYNYSMFGINLPPDYQNPLVTAHPGQTGVIINITITSVRERESGIPSQFSLKQNFPNPFNPTTSIDYDISSASHVQLIVFNILGQEVVRLVDQEQLPGKYRAVFDASKLAGGVYLYRLQTGVFSDTRKIILVK